MFKGKERRPGRGRGEREWTTPGKDIGKGFLELLEMWDQFITFITKLIFRGK